MIHLQRPVALWLLLSLGVLLWLYTIRPKYRTLDHPAAFLWARVPGLSGRDGRRRPFWRERSFRLQALLLSTIVAAAAAPTWIPAGAEDKDIVVVVDNDHSMNALEEGSPRIERARQAIDGLIDEMAGQRMAIVAALPQPHLVVPFSKEPGVLRAGLERIDPVSMAADLDEALEAARRIGGSGAEIVLVGARSASSGKDACERIDLGPPAPNMAISAVGIDPIGDGYRVWTRVRWTGPGRASTRCTWRTDRGHAGERLLAFDEPGTEDVTFDLRGSEITSLTILLPTRDALPSDNRADLLVRPPEISVRLKSAVPQVRYVLEEMEAVTILGKGEEGDAAIEVVDAPAVVLADDSDGGMSAAGRLILSTGSVLIDREGWSALADHPLLCSIDPGRLDRMGRRGVRPEGRDAVIFGTDGAALITCRDRSGNGAQEEPLREVTLAADWGPGGWISDLSFPVVIANAVNWLAGSTGPAHVLEAGEVFCPSPSLFGEALATGSLRITLPDGSLVIPGREVMAAGFPGTGRAGLYRWETDSHFGGFTVLPTEEALSAAWTGPRTSSEAPSPRFRMIALEPLLALAALIGLAAATLGREKGGAPG